MSIVKKTILMIVLITVALFSIVYFISNYIYLRGFENLEKLSMEQDLQRSVDALSVKETSLNRFSVDWAEWDDTYNFAKKFNQEYLDRNLMDETFIANDINVLLFLNIQGELVYGKLFDFNSMKETALPDTLPAYLSDIIVPDAALSADGFSGITMFSGRPMVTSCRFILTSLSEGPSTGYLVAGRFIDDLLITRLSETTSLTIAYMPVQTSGQSPELEKVMNSIEDPGAVFMQAQPGNKISGYAIVNDISGNPAFIFKVTIPRDVHAQGVKAIGYLHSSLFVITIVFCGAFVFFFRSLILSRLTSLSRAVSSIGSKGDISNRVQIKGKDELSGLADNINSMLESLEKSESRRQSQKEIIGHIITFTPNGILALNETGQISIINDAFRDMFNLNDRNMIGAKLEDLPDMTDIAVGINNFRLSRMTSFKKEIQRTRAGITKIYIATYARLKEEEMYILYLTDISEERAKQESMYLTDRLASIGEMASGIAHELNNPLTSIIGLSEIVMRDNVPESVKEDMGLIKSESHRAAAIVRNLLSFARKNATLKQAASINKIVTDVLRLRSYEHGVNNIKIVKELDPNLPDIMVDYSQIQQVFINIILNAEYAMVASHGKGTLTIKTESVNNMLKITFSDDGPGIETGNLRHIFDPFFTTKEIGKGTGLGLSISYGIVTAHDGRIYATSELGKGATFVIELPLKSSNTKEAKPDA